ncbi:hypothetical protein N7448_010764 [Penicillium atrosanguineum]|uniref:Uncharacterized protein n=1 Tax=Penicillium atrosanguineum TaxID=1132637 RepID=A0A9W9TZG0_9EURO|nr:Argininosuccinate lyase [Penicillium atrosanguineum]KAJ5119056.1 hypothetical protein N7526_010693 [Penicillium atrosanguineum]KAJ5120095.1 hypothetical protein N7448_010764 [Penicillium atrosanguineum]KAJ5297093.1 Argininosuccinate lyase [Penicillium atrosanguineum]KAJ5299852.1 hypothetical protein N7476_011409 [Penicillium atrosanguineum]
MSIQWATGSLSEMQSTRSAITGQDFYPTFLKDQVGMDATDTTVITVLNVLLSYILSGAIIPASILPRNMSLAACAFFEQFFVGDFGGRLVGLTYQLGNLGSSASATIQSITGERYPLSLGPDGKKRFNYGKVVAIFMGAMSQEERDEEAEAAQHLQRLRAEVVSLAEIGQRQFKGKRMEREDLADVGHAEGTV